MDFRGPLLKLAGYMAGDTPLIEVVISFFVVFLIIFMVFPIHECAHALTAKWLGDDTAEREGRLTLNPFVHIDRFGVLIMLIFPIGYAKPVNINPSRFHNGIKPKTGMAITAVAGPLSNILISYILLIILKLIAYSDYWSESEQMVYWTTMALNYAISINLFLAVFNLIPVSPLDGSKILFCFLKSKQIFFMMRYEAIIRMIVFALIVTGILTPALLFLSNGIYGALDFLSGFLYRPPLI